MLQPYPESDAGRINENAERHVELLKQLTNACRTLRSEMKLGPQQKVPLLAQGDRAALTAFTPYILPLARLTDITIVDELPQADAPVVVIESAVRNVGVALQACLHRTPGDVARMNALGARVRLVKGAYKEPATLAYQHKAEVDDAFATLACRLLELGDRKSTRLNSSH